MAVTIKIHPKENSGLSITVPQMAKLENLSYGCMDNDYCMEFDELGAYTVLYDADCIGRGFEAWVENDVVCLRIPLPNTEKDIRHAYSLAQKICRYFDVESFLCDDDLVPFEHIPKKIERNINASLGGLRAIEDQVLSSPDNSILLFGATNPVVIGISELQEIGGSMEGFEKFLARLQQMDVFYANPRFYKLPGERVFGLYFVGENIMTVVPCTPSYPFAKIDNLKGYYVRVPDGNDIPYADFIERATNMGPYDATHDIVCLTERDLAYLAENCSVNVDTDENVKGRYWGRELDNGRRHMRKIRNMQLAVEELAGLNHIAVLLRWAAENNLLSDKLKKAMPQLEELATSPNVDLRLVIQQSPDIDCAVREDHFKKQAFTFLKRFYIFNSDKGFPSCVDRYAEKRLGSEKYNCEEYKNEAYLFVPFDEDYYQGLKKCLDKEWKKFNR